MDGAKLFVAQHNPQSQARGAAAVLHALANVDVVDGGDGVVGGEDVFNGGADAGVFPGFDGGNESHGIVGERDELAVEEVGTDGGFEGDLGFGDLNDVQIGEIDVEGMKEAPLVTEQ